MRHKIILYLAILVSFSSCIQSAENWVATLSRPDGEEIVFNFQMEEKSGKTILYVINDAEKILVDNLQFRNDSVIIQMPVFESVIKAEIGKEGWKGVWTKGGSVSEQVMPFIAVKMKDKFIKSSEKSAFDISGRWAVRFANDSSVQFPAVAEFTQTGNKLSGTFLTPTGDYRYLDGVVSGNKIMLSTFDGGHAFLFTATIDEDAKISDGQFYSGLTYKEGWYAVKNENGKVNVDAVAMAMKPGEERLDFSFPDLNGKIVSINDDRFKDKVVIVQIMGSWCPNCMDETAFLSDYYDKNKNRGVEVISLAYEYSTDFDRSVKSLKKFQQLFNVQYPMLITGVSITDSLRTEKTLPQVTPIKFFPSSIIIDKKGIVRKFDTEFVGPGTGKYFDTYTATFYAFIEELLQEK